MNVRASDIVCVVPEGNPGRAAHTYLFPGGESPCYIPHIGPPTLTARACMHNFDGIRARQVTGGTCVHDVCCRVHVHLFWSVRV